MVAAELGNWDAVMFLLDHGVKADHVADDGNTLRKIVAAKKREGASDPALDLLLRR